MFNNCWVADGGECLGYAYYGGILMTMTSYTKRCTSTRRVCWCKFGWNPTRSFCVICSLVSLSLILRQGLCLDFACLFIYSLAISPEFFVCLSIYENVETLSRGRGLLGGPCPEESCCPCLLLPAVVGQLEDFNSVQCLSVNVLVWSGVRFTDW